jgi:hypothetical protein
LNHGRGPFLSVRVNTIGLRSSAWRRMTVHKSLLLVGKMAQFRGFCQALQSTNLGEHEFVGYIAVKSSLKNAFKLNDRHGIKTKQHQ